MLFVCFTSPPLFGYLATTQHALYFAARGFSAEEASLMLAVGGVLSVERAHALGRGRRPARRPHRRLPLVRSLAHRHGCACSASRLWPLRVVAYAYVLFLFLPLGSRATIVSVLLSRITPPAHYGVIFGILGIGNNLGAAAGPWMSGALFDRTGSYLRHLSLGRGRSGCSASSPSPPS